LMAPLLSGYAGYYNRRYHRSGYVFQKRFKSILCDADNYLKELVGYIHLNPLRAAMVENSKELERYRWTGHAGVFGRHRQIWYDVDAGSGIADIKLYDFNTKIETLVVNGMPCDPRTSDISGNWVAWANWPNQPSKGIYLYDISQGTSSKISDQTANYPWNPSASDAFVVWEDTNDIYLYDISTSTVVPFAFPGNQWNVTISGNMIAWQDDRDGNWEIYMCQYDAANQACVGGERRLTNDSNNQVNPSIYQNKIVWGAPNPSHPYIEPLQ